MCINLTLRQILKLINMKNLIVYVQIVVAAICFTNCAKEETFEYYNISGTVINAKTEDPLEGAKVYLIKYTKDNSLHIVNESNGIITTIIDSTETDIDGTFSFSQKGSTIEVIKSGFTGRSYIDNGALFPVGKDGNGKVIISLTPL
jgi:hypothetical protein